jgi:hypothetical protein
MGFFGRIKDSLTRTKQQIVERFDEIVGRADEEERRSRPVDVDTLDALEELLISADIGVAATDRIIKAVKTRSRNGTSLRDLVKQEIKRVFASVERPAAVVAPPTVTLKRGMTRNIELAAWHELVILGDVAARKNVTLTMYDVTGDPVVRYHLTNAWPSKLEIGALKAGASSVLTETVTLVAEFIQRVSV